MEIKNNNSSLGRNKNASSQKMNNNINDSSTIISQKKATKKATFMLPIDLHKCLKTSAADQGKTMLEIVEEALKNHLKV